MNQLLRRFRQYESEGDWVRLVMEGTGAFCRQAALFVLEGDLLRLRAQVNFELPEILSFPPGWAGAFETVCTSKEPVTALRTPTEVTEALSTTNSGERAHLFPITNDSRVAAVLFASDSDDTDVNALELIVGIASSVLERQSNTQLHSQIAIFQHPARTSPESSADLSDATPETSGKQFQDDGDTPGVLYHRHPTERSTAAAAGGTATLEAFAPPLPLANAGTLPAWADLDEHQRQLHMRAQRFARVTVAEMQLAKPGECRAGREKANFYLFLNKEIDKAREIYRKQFMTISSMVDYLHLELVQTAVEGDDRKLGADYPGQLV